MITKTLNYIKKNKVTTIILAISIICLITSLAICCPILSKLKVINQEIQDKEPGKLIIVSQEQEWNRDTYETSFEYKYTGDKPLHSNLVAAACDVGDVFATTYLDNFSYKQGDTITILVRRWDGKSTVYLYYGDRVLAKS